MSMADLKPEDQICCICLSDAVQDCPELFGPWMQKKYINVHYFCLLLATNLPQRGKDTSGICGFLLRDIRDETKCAKKRTCDFCGKQGAAIMCEGCKIYFHLSCGLRNGCLFQYAENFHSYCADCYTLDDFQQETQKNWRHQRCHICNDSLDSSYSPVEHLHADCCKNGFAHRRCLQKYATFAGYYLLCIWCRSKSFRNQIRFKGIFVPDREANWESREAYRHLHTVHKRCDMDRCHCPDGREFSSKKWRLVNCCLCGSVGAHYPHCVPTPTQPDEMPRAANFKCDICTGVESNMTRKRNLTASIPDRENAVDVSFYVSTQREATADNLNTENICNEEAADQSNFASSLTQSDSSTQTSGSGNENFALEIFKAYEFTADWEIVGSSKFLLNTNSSRFAGKTKTEIFNTPGLLQEKDIIERSNDIGVFKEINEYLDGLDLMPTLSDLFFDPD